LYDLALRRIATTENLDEESIEDDRLECYLIGFIAGLTELWQITGAFYLQAWCHWIARQCFYRYVNPAYMASIYRMDSLTEVSADIKQCWVRVQSLGRGKDSASRFLASIIT
jgi:hypothetical protein